MNLNKQYSLFHIDRHYDLMASQIDEWVAHLNAIGFNYQAASIDELQAILFTRPDNPDSGAFPLFRWNNYITILDRLYPALWLDRSFVTHREGDVPDDYDLNELNFEMLPENLSYWLQDKRHKSVLNLDIDYFFIRYNQRHIQLFTDEFIKVVAKEIVLAWDNIEVLTIALSPECCGGWDNAIRVAKVITNELHIDWELE